MPLRVLVAGFEPFGGAPSNPSGDAALALDGRVLTTLVRGSSRTAHLAGVRLPVLWSTAAELLIQHIHDRAPHIVLGLGMADTSFRVEQIADDHRHAVADNAGVVALANTATRRFCTRLPRLAIERSLRALVGRARVTQSTDAGGFICNEVFFAQMERHADETSGLLRAGFIHVPSYTVVPAALVQATVNEAISRALRRTIEDLSVDEYQATER